MAYAALLHNTVVSACFKAMLQYA